MRARASPLPGVNAGATAHLVTRALRIAALPLVPALMLAACATPGSYPSLAKRPFETAAPPPPAPAGPGIELDTAALRRIAGARESALAARGAYAEALGIARKAVASAQGAAAASEPWIAAQMAVSRLERTLGPAQSALAELDAERRALLLANPGADQLPIDAATAEIGAIARQQEAAVAELAERLSRR